MYLTTEEMLQSIRESIAVAAALGQSAEVAEIGIALTEMVDEARAAYRRSQRIPTTPRSGEDIGHAFGDIPLCRGCNIEISGASPFCGECSHDRAEAAIASVRGEVRV